MASCQPRGQKGTPGRKKDRKRKRSGTNDGKPTDPRDEAETKKVGGEGDGEEEGGEGAAARSGAADAGTGVADPSSPAADGAKTNDDEDRRTVFVGNLPPSATRKSLASIFKDAEGCGRVVSARLRSAPAPGTKLPPERAGDRNLMRKVCAITSKVDPEAPRSNAQGYVVFESPSSVDAALKLNNLLVDGRRIRVDRVDEPTVDASRTVFVGNLPYRSDESTLACHFVRESGGTIGRTDVEGVRIVRDRDTSQCKGFGYVLLKERSLVQTALGLHGTRYMKKELRVMVCGRRFKGRRGAEKEDEKRKGRGFEGRRATTVGPSAERARKRRARSERNAARAKNSAATGKTRAAGSGVSKRAAKEAKAGRRVKKLEARVRKGMGKARKGRS